MTTQRELKIQTEVGNRVRKAMTKVYRQNAAVGFDADRAAKIDALVASGRFTDQDRNALNAMTPETLDKLSAKKAKEVTIDMRDDDADRLSKEDAPNHRDDPRGNSADADYSGRATPGFVVIGNTEEPITHFDIMCEQGKITPQVRDARNAVLRDHNTKRTRAKDPTPRTHAVVDESLADMLPPSLGDVLKARRDAEKK